MTSARGGTQSIERSIRLLRALASRARFGWRLTDLARHCEMDKGTARRILHCLVRERLAERGLDDQRYLPGPLLFELSLSLPEHDEFRTRSFPLLERLARETRTVAFLCLRSGDDLVCAARVGEVPEQAFTLNPGTRRPLINSSAGAALLAAMPEDEREAVFERNCRSLEPSGYGRGTLERLLKRSVEMGMGYNEGCYVPSWNSYAHALRSEQEAWAAVMISAPANHFVAEQLRSDLEMLRTTSERMQDLANIVFARSRRAAPVPEGADPFPEPKQPS